jgi:hypothetical protein
MIVTAGDDLRGKLNGLIIAVMNSDIAFIALSSNLPSVPAAPEQVSR